MSRNTVYIVSAETMVVDPAYIGNSNKTTLQGVLEDLSGAIDDAVSNAITAAEDVTVTPSGNLEAANVLSALYELQEDIDGLAVAGVNLSDATPAVATTGGTAGVLETVSRGDHAHVAQNAAGTAVSAISGMSGTNVQACLEELKSSVTSAGTVANDSITNAKLANMNPSTFKGQPYTAGSPTDPVDMTVTQVLTTLQAKAQYKEFGVIATVPTSALSSPTRVNIFPVDTSAGNVNVSSPGAPGTLGIKVGDTLIFRKATSDVNTVYWTGTLIGATSGTVSLINHYKDDLAQIELLCISLTGTYYMLLNH